MGQPPGVTRIERAARAVVRAVDAIPGARWVLTTRVVALPGYWFATLCGLIWGAILALGRIRSQGGVIVAHHMPRWSFGRGGTTIGAVFLTRDRLAPDVLAHEAVHRAQWRRYGLAFIPLYLAAGANPFTNRFEIEAGLEKGGYR